MGDAPTVAFKIMDRADWRAALAEGVFEGSDADRADGFIHLSTQPQLAETAAKHYAGRDDLALLTVDLNQLEDVLVWEPSRGGELFPHLYGPLPTACVTGMRGLSVSADGVMTLTDEPAP